MSSQQTIVDYLVEQASGAGHVVSRKMFGEHALYCDGTLVALICDDRLFLKPTAAARAMLGDVEEAPPYPGAKPSFVVPEDRWEDAEWLAALVRISAAALPRPGARSPRKPKRIGAC